MKAMLKRPFALVLLYSASLSAAVGIARVVPNLMPFRDLTGAVATFNTAGKIREDNPFFQSLGTNGRTCATCHQPNQAFSLSAAGVRQLYQRSHGTDPPFCCV
jgi:cytochrome c peroxidase